MTQVKIPVGFVDAVHSVSRTNVVSHERHVQVRVGFIQASGAIAIKCGRSDFGSWSRILTWVTAPTLSRRATSSNRPDGHPAAHLERSASGDHAGT